MNPYKEARLKLGLTQDRLAKATGLTRLTILRTEQGLYTMPSPHITGYLSERAPLITDGTVQGGFGPNSNERAAVAGSTENLIRLYTNWVKMKRYEHPRCLGDLHKALGEGAVDPKTKRLMHPLVALRQRALYSQIGLCVEICVNPGPIHKWERFEQAHMPEQLREALLDNGYSEWDVGYLESYASKCYEKVSGRPV